jgi:hypothetical protein
MIKRRGAPENFNGDEGNVSDQIDLPSKTGGFLVREHYKLRFTELSETFFGRLILAKCPDPDADTAITVQFSLCDIFRRGRPEELVASLEGVAFSEAPKIMETGADLLSAVFGVDLRPHATTKPALDYYQSHIASRLGWLKSGDAIDNKLPCIEDVTPRVSGKLIHFDIVVRPSILRERLGEYIPANLELVATLLKKLDGAARRPADPGPRIDYRKQVELLTNYLDDRQVLTGETAFSLLSNQIPFRWALQEFAGGLNTTMPQIGTSEVGDKILLPLFLEVNGFLDILDIDLESGPLEHSDVVVRYSIRRPPARNIFGASNAGLDAKTRSQLSETELVLYHRLHNAVREGLVFGGKPKLERAFGDVCAWLTRKAAYCLEEPTFLGRPGREWLSQHIQDKKIQMEDEFFLPAIYERLRDAFSSRVVKKPERAGGEIDLLFDDTIPIELKVRRGYQEPLDVADVDEKFRPGGQAAVYSAVSRLGFVVVLDLPDAKAQVVNLENCATVIERRFPENAEYPTCIVLIAFRCYDRTPSTSA